LTCAATTAQAARPWLEGLSKSATPVEPVVKPNAMNKDTVNVMLELSGDPVAVQQETAGRKLTKPEKDAAKGKLKGDQDKLRAGIASLGGKVVGDYQVTYNGLKVNIARSKADQLASLPGVVGVRPLQLMKPSNTRGVPLIGTPAVWDSFGLHGEGVKVAIIDT